MDIQWYPGHMVKAKRKIQENLKLVDIVIELLDARVPLSSRNPEIDTLAAGKERIIVLNKFDLSSPGANSKWQEYFENTGAKVVMVNSINGAGINAIYPSATELMAEKIARQKARGRLIVPIRAVVAGIPNVGKSTFINKLYGKGIAKTGDRPGVTKANQWIKVKADFELLDTPGILWPKFEDKIVGRNLAITGAIKDEIMDIEALSRDFIGFMRVNYPQLLKQRYNVDYSEEATDHEIFEMIAKARGFLLKGQEVDYKRCAVTLLDEFRGGVLGKISLEVPEEKQAE